MFLFNHNEHKFLRITNIRETKQEAKSRQGNETRVQTIEPDDRRGVGSAHPSDHQSLANCLPITEHLFVCLDHRKIIFQFLCLTNSNEAIGKIETKTKVQLSV